MSEQTEDDPISSTQTPDALAPADHAVDGSFEDVGEAGFVVDTPNRDPDVDDAIAIAQTPREVLPRSTDDSLNNAKAVAKVCDDFRAENVVVLDVTQITPEFDYFVISTAGSRRQMHAIIDEADRALEFGGHKRRSIEGYDNTAWIVQDYGDVILHVFLEDARELYDLENLWGDAKTVDWRPID